MKMETKKEAPKPTFKVDFQVKSEDSSIIYRKDGLPFIIDKTDKAIKWLIANDFKEKDIQIIGEKPAIWDDLFSPPKSIEPEPTQPTLVEQATKILTPINQVPEISLEVPVSVV